MHASCWPEGLELTADYLCSKLMQKLPIVKLCR
jgi:hypothetical protein